MINSYTRIYRIEGEKLGHGLEKEVITKTSSSIVNISMMYFDKVQLELEIQEKLFNYYLSHQKRGGPIIHLLRIDVFKESKGDKKQLVVTQKRGTYDLDSKKLNWFDKQRRLRYRDNTIVVPIDSNLKRFTSD